MTEKSKLKPELHDGHRQRMRQKYKAGGGAAMADHELLEMLLFHSIPRANTNEIAHRLLDHFGTLTGVLQADLHELSAVEGVGERSAQLIGLCGDLYRRADIEELKVPRYLRTLEEAGAYVLGLLDGLPKERAILLLLSADYRLLSTHVIAEGTANSTTIDEKKILKYVILSRASHYILAHNHPDPLLQASEDDEMVSLSLMQAGDLLGVNFWEHILVSDGRYLFIMQEIVKRKKFKDY